MLTAAWCTNFWLMNWNPNSKLKRKLKQKTKLKKQTNFLVLVKNFFATKRFFLSVIHPLFILLCSFCKLSYLWPNLKYLKKTILICSSRRSPVRTATRPVRGWWRRREWHRRRGKGAVGIRRRVSASNSNTRWPWWLTTNSKCSSTSPPPTPTMRISSPVYSFVCRNMTFFTTKKNASPKTLEVSRWMETPNKV